MTRNPKERMSLKTEEMGSVQSGRKSWRVRRNERRCMEGVFVISSSGGM